MKILLSFFLLALPLLANAQNEMVYRDTVQTNLYQLDCFLSIRKWGLSQGYSIVEENLPVKILFQAEQKKGQGLLRYQILAKPEENQLYLIFRRPVFVQQGIVDSIKWKSPKGTTISLEEWGKLQKSTLLHFSEVSNKIQEEAEYWIPEKQPGEDPQRQDVDYKPVLYFYPTKETDIQASLLYQGKITFTYPQTSDANWHFRASPSGKLTFSSGNEARYLFWEGIPDSPRILGKEGFLVKKSELSDFLAKITETLGLTSTEQADFLSYWLPQMQKYPYCKLRFAGSDYSNSARLDIQPQPDKILRIFMIWEGTDTPEEMIPQSIQPFKRSGFTVIEWGGTQIQTAN